MSIQKTKTNPIRKFFKALGPGVITGAADDDPSGVATYSVAGAQLGTSMLWTAFVTWPLMACVQNMCARIGMVTGKGLAGSLQQKFPRWLILIASVALWIANTINVGADLAGMADAAGMLIRVKSPVFIILFGVGIAWATVNCRYNQIASILKWLALVLFSYVITAFVIRPDWRVVAHDSFIPTLPKGHEAWSTLVAILGTTISPYLFFWQASQEVEEEKAKGRRVLVQRLGASESELQVRRLDVGVGTFFSNLVMFFIILTCAMALHKRGLTEVQTSRQAAEALRPFAGGFATALYAVGIIGVGLLAIPTLTASAAYALAEIFHWRQGLDKSLEQARPFYMVVILSTVAAMAMEFAHISPVKALYWTAIINGLLAPFLLAGILAVASDRKLMNGQPSSRISRLVVLLTTFVMFVAAIAMFLV
jgi:NRAMP (natural resistance-associated macrophage protein)-like metal ion transporter